MNGQATGAQVPGQTGHRWKRFWAGLFPSDRAALYSGEGVRPEAFIFADFHKQVCKASELLDFLMSEGYPYDIPDHIIDEIEAARELLKNADPPTPDQRAKLLKAYRDLIKIPRTSATFESLSLPPPGFWQRRSWLCALLVFSILPSVVLVYIQQYYWALTILGGSALGIWGCYLFTGAATNCKLNQMIKFCYVFTGVALLASVLPFISPKPLEDSLLGAPVGVLQACAYPLDGSPDSHPKEVRCANDSNKIENHQWVLRIGGTAVKPADGQNQEHKIRGGMIVPLYLVILALIGSAVSMTRRVPEYQRRAMDSHEGYTNETAREDLVFQIMQVLSAPLIAVTAYYIVKPESPSVSVVLGFASGFASEPILLMIRSLVEKIAPAAGQTAKPIPIEVRVEPLVAARKAEQTQQFTAKVLNSPNTEVTWVVDPSDGSAGTISQSGYYVAPKGPITPKTATITARSVADRTKSARATVTLE
jgi:hypothetical protein